jgi:peptide chain release factor 1
MLQKLEEVEKRFVELEKQISDPEVIAQTSKWQQLMKEHSNLIDIVAKYREYKKAVSDMESAKEICFTDKELKELAEIEIEELKEKTSKNRRRTKIFTNSKRSDDDKNIISENKSRNRRRRSSTFCRCLFRMYTMYAESKYWKIDILNRK